MSSSFSRLLPSQHAASASKDIGLTLILTCHPPCENTHQLCMKLVIRQRVMAETSLGLNASIPFPKSSAIKETRCSILSTAQNMPTLEDAISLVCQTLNQADPTLRTISNLVASGMFGAAEALRASPDGPQVKLTFTNLLIVNVEAGHFGSEVLESYFSQVRKKLEECLRPRASLVDSLKLVGTTEKKENACVVCMSELSNGAGNVREMPCRHQYHEECISNWLEYNQSCPLCRHSLRSD
ncbi:hypothetical protein AMTRI_Chr06g199870 [Amborella trichopoda]|uniref:RING-type domain-containing protein n=1 Tax=Amborella trichopoda TaxID=13333 RepID=W1Q039_AMBTC|nr:hypothetical protein AMTR_s00049p00160360 [Amborella trichopoda]